MIHLDTNFLIQSLVAGSESDRKIQAWLASGEALGISTIAWSEFLCGPLTTDQKLLTETFLDAKEPFLASDAEKAAELFNGSGRRSRSFADCQIAAVALRCNVGLATLNRSDFVAFEPFGLVIF